MNTSNTYTRREELQRLSVKNGLRPIARSLGIKNYSNMRKNFLIENILEIEIFLQF